MRSQRSQEKRRAVQVCAAIWRVRTDKDEVEDEGADGGGEEGGRGLEACW